MMLWRSSRGSLKRQFAYRDAAERSERIYLEGCRRIQGLTPRPYPDLNKGRDYLVVALVATGVLLAPAFLAATSTIPNPFLVRPPIGSGECLDRYVDFDGDVNWTFAGKVDCSSDNAKVKVTGVVKSDKTRTRCWKVGQTVVRSHSELCVVPILKAGMCVPAWKSDFRWYGYFTVARECEQMPSEPLEDDSPGNSYRWGWIRLVKVGPPGSVKCDSEMGEFLLSHFNLEACADDA